MAEDHLEDYIDPELIEDVPTPLPAQRGDLLKMLIATACGLGFLRPAPGTWGSTPSCALAWAMLLAGAQLRWVTFTMAMTAAFGLLGSLFIGGYAERRFGR